MCTSGQRFIQSRDSPTLLHQCAEFGVASSKINKLGGSYAYKVLHLWHVLPAPLKTGNQNGTWPAIETIGPKSLTPILSLVWPAALTRHCLQGLARSHVTRVMVHGSLCKFHYLLSAVPARQLAPHQSRSNPLFELELSKCLDTNTYLLPLT